MTAVALMAGASGASAHFNSKKAIWGPERFADGSSVFPLYQRIGVSIFETDLLWRDAAPTRPRNARDPNDPAYHWNSGIDYAVAQAQRYHMRVLLEVIATPAWANGGRPFNWAPSRIRDFQDFVAAAARRYRSVHLWMIWGEPDRGANFQPMTYVAPGTRHLSRAQKSAPHTYAQMLDASYAALKKVSKRNLVIGGNSYTTAGNLGTGGISVPTKTWIQNLRLPNGKPPRMDLYGHNPFTLRDPNLKKPPSPGGEVDFSDLGRLSRVVDHNLAPRRRHGKRHRRNRHKHIKLFLAEFSIPTAPGDQEFGYWVDPPVAARWVTDAWRIVNHSRFIYGFGWIHLVDGDVDQNTAGLFDAQFHPKPTYYAFQAG